METASTPSEMPPPQTKDVIKNGKGKYPDLVNYAYIFVASILSIPCPSCSFVSWIFLMNVMDSFSFSMIFAQEHMN